MTNLVQKQTFSRPVRWISTVKRIEIQRKKASSLINGNLYHYAANNPVKYTDPDGKTAKNNTDQYVVIRLESDNEPCHYMILAPGDFITADCDGAIFSSSNMIKVSAWDKIKAAVNFTILGDNYPDESFEIDDTKSNITNKASDLCKIGYNKALPLINKIRSFCGKDSKSELDISGQYSDQKQEGAALHSWWKGITDSNEANLGSTQEKWKEMYETNKVQKELQQKYLRKEGTNE
ncbi:MAG: hypothetical protein K6E51_05230 [Treponema sp.]|nr:hypothetical protein [Treponema sp.]